MRAPLMPASSTSRLKSTCRKVSTCCRVRNAIGTLADCPVVVSSRTENGYSVCGTSAAMQNTSMRALKGEQGIFAPQIDWLEVAARRIYHRCTKVLSTIEARGGRSRDQPAKGEFTSRATHRDQALRYWETMNIFLTVEARFLHPNWVESRGAMSGRWLLFLVFALGGVQAQERTRGGNLDPRSESDLRLVTWTEGVEIIRVAWHNLSKFDSPIDCSHLVNEIYQLAGLRYPYATSNQLYAGLDGFERVQTPQPADLIVWPGHVGLVVNPQEHSFYSSLNSGLKIDSYDAPAWQARGPARFFRFLVHNDQGPPALERAEASRQPEGSLDDLQIASAAPSQSSRKLQEPSSDPVLLKWERPDRSSV